MTNDSFSRRLDILEAHPAIAADRLGALGVIRQLTIFHAAGGLLEGMAYRNALGQGFYKLP